MPEYHMTMACKCGNTYCLAFMMRQEVPCDVQLMWTCGACSEQTMLCLRPDQGCSPREMLAGAVLDALEDMPPEEVHAAVDEAVVRKVMDA